jgi:glycine/serine hydroxymethyltransferase
MKEEEMKVIGQWIARAIRERESEPALKEIAGQVRELGASFTLYPRRLSEASRRAGTMAT